MRLQHFAARTSATRQPKPSRPSSRRVGGSRVPTAEQAETAEMAQAGSDNPLIEVDGKLVPNYDATIQSFSEVER